MALRKDLLTAVAGRNPSGENLRYSPVYDKIKEARREDSDIPQGEWQHVRKLASWRDVAKLTADALAVQSKDLQLAVWFSEALLRQQGLGAFAETIEFIAELLRQFWETLYPELEDGDAELRAALLDWFGNRMGDPLGQVALTKSGLSFTQYKQSRTMGYEADATTEAKRSLRNQLIEEGRVTPEQFDEAVNATPGEFYLQLELDLRQCLSQLAALSEVADERFGDAGPSFRSLQNTLEEMAQTVRIQINRKGLAPVSEQAREEPEENAAFWEPDPEPVRAPAPAAVAQRAAAPVSPVIAAPAENFPAAAPAVSTGTEPADKDEAIARVAAVARWLRAKDCYNIEPYLMLRGLRWGELRYNGAQIDTAMLEAPPAEIRMKLKQLRDGGKWEELVEAAEEAMALPCGRGWLDLQFYSVRGLEGRGEWFKEVATAVRTELRGLLSDLPALQEMSLTDGTPASSVETAAWIRAEILSGAVPVAAPVRAAEVMSPALAEAAEAPPNLSNGTGAAEDDAFERAKALLRSGQLSQAVQALSDELARERTGRGRFQRRMQLAHLFLLIGRPHIAQPILEDLAREVDGRKLEEWEDGEAIAYPLTLLFRCLRTLDTESERRETIYARICRLAPARALELER